VGPAARYGTCAAVPVYVHVDTTFSRVSINLRQFDLTGLRFMTEQQGLGTAPPLAAISFNDQAGTLWIVTILATIYVILSALVRAYVKWGIYGIDDYLLAIATVR